MDSRTQQIMNLALQGKWDQVGRLASNFRRESAFKKGKRKTAETQREEFFPDLETKEIDPQ